MLLYTAENNVHNIVHVQRKSPATSSFPGNSKYLKIAASRDLPLGRIHFRLDKFNNEISSLQSLYTKMKTTHSSTHQQRQTSPLIRNI
ncbi:unnamed protein product [Brugia pahangi]|uniref:Uncharacterized protein n=1 Tax=Brugia pahangi TaxID=6280 RepID=A0A0N4TSJ1_BRUPA|nr:unnamed protein product [Brugia pahangi]